MANRLLELSLADTYNNVPIESKALGDKIFSVMKNFSENKEYNKVGWLSLSVLENSVKENYESRALNSQLKVLFL